MKENCRGRPNGKISLKNRMFEKYNYGARSSQKCRTTNGGPIEEMFKKNRTFERYMLVPGGFQSAERGKLLVQSQWGDVSENRMSKRYTWGVGTRELGMVLGGFQRLE